MKGNVMDLNGKITKVSKTYSYVVLNDNIKVHFGILLADNSSLKLPEVGTKVHFKNCYGDSTIFVLTTNSLMEEQKVEAPVSSNPFMKYVGDHGLTEKDLVKLHPLITMLEENFTQVGSSEVLLYDVLGALYGVGVLITTVPFPVSHYKRVEIISDKYKGFPYWSFGAHNEQTELFGYLYFDTTCGVLLLKDSHHRFPLVIQNISECCLEALLDCYVTLSNFKIFTEVYNEKSIPNVEYVIAAFHSIKVISRVKRRVAISAELPKAKFTESLCFKVLRKSMTCVGSSNRPEMWFEIAILDGGNAALITDTYFLILPHTHIKVASILHESCTYKLFHNSPLREEYEIRLSRFKPYKILKLSTHDRNVYCQILMKEKHETLLSVEECKKHIETSAEIVSFEGVIMKKMFSKPLFPNQKKQTNLYGYGTPGVKTHFLVFSFSTEQGSVIYLECYLNDWENTLMPLGLLPSMRIKVRHVLPQSRKYLKSTPFTSFEVVSYEPIVNFETVNLYLHDDIDWGKRSFLGKGNDIPFGTFIWGRICNAEVLSIELTTYCQSCKDLLEETKSTSCSCTKDITCLIKMLVEDEFGQSQILAKAPKLLRLILDFTERQFEIWLKAFKQIGYFKYTVWDEESPLDISTAESIFAEVLKRLLKQFNDCAIVQLDLKCRLLCSNPEKNQGRPLWFLVDARRNVKQR